MLPAFLKHSDVKHIVALNWSELMQLALFELKLLDPGLPSPPVVSDDSVVAPEPRFGGRGRVVVSQRPGCVEVTEVTGGGVVVFITVLQSRSAKIEIILA